MKLLKRHRLVQEAITSTNSHDIGLIAEELVEIAKKRLSSERIAGYRCTANGAYYYLNKCGLQQTSDIQRTITELSKAPTVTRRLPRWLRDAL